MPEKFCRAFEITALDDTNPIAVVPATWIDSLPSPMWAGLTRPSFPLISSPECMLNRPGN